MRIRLSWSRFRISRSPLLLLASLGIFALIAACTDTTPTETRRHISVGPRSVWTPCDPDVDPDCDPYNPPDTTVFFHICVNDFDLWCGTYRGSLASQSALDRALNGLSCPTIQNWYARAKSNGRFGFFIFLIFLTRRTLTPIRTTITSSSVITTLRFTCVRSLRTPIDGPEL